MKYFLLIFLSCLGLNLFAQNLIPGMSPQAVEAKIGKPISTMEIADRSVIIYADQRKLEFKSGKLVSENGVKLQAPTASLLNAQDNSELKIDIPVIRNDMTITESIQAEEQAADQLDQLDQLYNFGGINDNLDAAIENYESAHTSSPTNQAREHLRDVLIGFILEIIITYIVLQIAFNLSGFPCLFYQIASLSLAVAVVGAGLDYLLSIGLLNPIRLGLSFMLLLILIRQFTDVREWATAIRIAILARMISIALMWLSLAGLMVLFGL
ncbi:MAG TPA: hypothetical protein DEA90_00400 [Opitutae bacterium]|nr:hypothetical protein [Puniceicoccaceae bacterium]HBR92606.1 hypothetical protein [Opitutae bacterium]|tara:strand:- start:1444 stop:2247 length:804 start_codon:yes stop_codon:yes gene_type:complete